MTLDEAKKVAAIMREADHRCNNCVEDLVKHANRIFPEFTWSFVDDWPEHESEVHVDYYTAVAGDE